MTAPDGDALLVDVDFAGFKVPACPLCGGILKPDVVFFGESVPAERVQAAYAGLERADAMLVVGSSLMVYSGYRYARAAAERGLPNRGRQPWPHAGGRAAAVQGAPALRGNLNRAGVRSGASCAVTLPASFPPRALCCHPVP
ncbi:NAD-dependent protein lipoamidase sirtuin-4, mitochondrial [Castellaniella defragrans]